MNCVIDAYIDNSSNIKYKLLGIWGKICFFYPLDIAIKSNLFENVYVYTNSAYVKYLVSECYKDKVLCIDECNFNHDYTCYIAGNAPLLTLDSLKKALNEKLNIISTTKYKVYPSWGQELIVEQRVNVIKIVYNKKNKIFTYCLQQPEGILLNSKKEFETILAITQKNQNDSKKTQRIHECINSKKEILNKTDNFNDICLIGHSHFDLWHIGEIQKHKIQNCGISGITSFQYQDYVFSKNLFHTDSRYIFLIQGINDFLYTNNVDLIVQNVLKNIEYIKNICKESKLFYFECLPVNGRLDRNNKYIKEFNSLLKKGLSNEVQMISNLSFDDGFGNLNYKFTYDGIHLNKNGYTIMQTLIEEVLYG